MRGAVGLWVIVLAAPARDGSAVFRMKYFDDWIESVRGFPEQGTAGSLRTYNKVR